MTTSPLRAVIPPEHEITGFACRVRGFSGQEGPILLSMTDLTVAPVRSDPELDGDHERMAHIVLEGVKPDDGDFVSAGPSVVEGIVNGTAVKALCGKVWIPGRDPKKYPLCPTCKEIAESMGWDVPTT
jgi:hypothetical protein